MAEPQAMIARVVSPYEAVEFRGGLALYDYQEEAVARLIESENVGHPDDVAAGIHGHSALTEPFGSGKTFIILALVMRNPIPRVQDVRLHDCISNAPYATIDAHAYTDQIIRPTAIVVGRSVYAQWLRNIRTYTSLRVFEARDKPTIEKLARAIAQTGEINDYDIVLIKHGRASSETQDTASLTRAINRATGSRVWSRAVYDDIDLITDCVCLRASSSVFVTGATDFAMYGYRSMTTQRLIDLSQRKLRDLIVNLPPVSHVFSGTRRYGRIWRECGHNPAEIAQNHGVYAIAWYDCRITSREIADATMLIENTEAANREELMRMINGDAMTSAARTLGATIVTPYAMFASVLGTQREDYEVAVARMRAFDMILAVPYESRAITEESQFNGFGGEESRRIITRADILERVGIPRDILTRANQRSRALDDVAAVSALVTAPVEMIEEVRARLAAILARLERSFERIGENLATRACSVCFGDFVSGETEAARRVTIMRCCGYVICAECCIRGSHFLRDEAGRVMGRCIQCRSALDLARDVVHVDSRANPADLVEAALRESRAGSFVVPPEEAAAPLRERAIADIRTKTAYVAAMLRGELARDEITTAHLVVRRAPMPAIVGLMVGTQMVPAREPRFIVCSTYDEALEDLSVDLAEREVDFAILNGSVHDFAEKIASFVEGRVRVLLLNTRALFAGVDLQCATDIIVMDGERTENFGQVVGRAQRMGRTCSLTVHLLSYVDDEKKSDSDSSSAPAAAHTVRGARAPRVSAEARAIAQASSIAGELIRLLRDRK